MAVTANLSITQLTEGQSQKEVTINTAFETFDKAIAGKLVKNVAGAVDVTLTAAEWTYAMYEFTGNTTADIAIIVPTATRRFSLLNATTGPPRTITLKTATGTGVVLVVGEHMVVEQNGDSMTALTGSTGGGGETIWSRSEAGASTLLSTMLAFWPLEEATGNRVDSVSAIPLVPTGGPPNITSGAGKIGQALYMNGAAGTYLSVADSATFSAGPNVSFTVACWIWVSDAGANMGFVGKGAVVPSTAYVEYLLWQYSGQWRFEVGNGSTFVTATSSFTPVANQWCCLIGWYDHVADLQYIQVNGGTPVSAANAAGSYDSALPFEVGRTAGFSSQSLSGRMDLVAFDKRVWTPQERADYWNFGSGLTHPFALPSSIAPLAASDRLVLSASSTTSERLEVDGGVKLGNSEGTVDGTIRWTGTDFEGRKGGVWVSLTT